MPTMVHRADPEIAFPPAPPPQKEVRWHRQSGTTETKFQTDEELLRPFVLACNHADVAAKHEDDNFRRQQEMLVLMMRHGNSQIINVKLNFKSL